MIRFTAVLIRRFRSWCSRTAFSSRSRCSEDAMPKRRSQFHQVHLSRDGVRVPLVRLSGPLARSVRLQTGCEVRSGRRWRAVYWWCWLCSSARPETVHRCVARRAPAFAGRLVCLRRASRTDPRAPLFKRSDQCRASPSHPTRPPRALRSLLSALVTRFYRGTFAQQPETLRSFGRGSASIFARQIRKPCE